MDDAVEHDVLVTGIATRDFPLRDAFAESLHELVSELSGVVGDDHGRSDLAGSFEHEVSGNAGKKEADHGQQGQLPPEHQAACEDNGCVREHERLAQGEPGLVLDDAPHDRRPGEAAARPEDKAVSRPEGDPGVECAQENVVRDRIVVQKLRQPVNEQVCGHREDEQRKDD